MSGKNVERTRRLFEAFNVGDIDAMLTYCDPGMEVHATFEAAVGGGVYEGHDGVRRWHKDTEEAWGDEIRIEPEAFFDLGEQTLVFSVLRGRGRRSGAEVLMPVAQIFTWRDGLGVLAKVAADRSEALRELGVTLDVLEPIAP